MEETNTDRLNELCGETPKHSRTCPQAGCHWTSSTYHDIKFARDVLSEHTRWVHNITKAEGVK